MPLMTMQEQVDQAQHGLQLTPEEMQEQLDAIDQAWEDHCQQQFENSLK